MAELDAVHTAALQSEAMARLQSFLGHAFGRVFTDHDWDHALGGMHVLLAEDGDLIGHAAVVQRRLVHGSRTFRTGYIESVAVREDRRGLGHGATLMDAVENAVRRAYDIGALRANANATGFYAARGWQRWQGPSRALTPRGLVRADPADGGEIYVFERARSLDPLGELICDWREGELW